MKKFLATFLVLLCATTVFASVGIKKQGVYQGIATDLNFPTGTATITSDGSTVTISPTVSGVAAITSGTIAGVTINGTTIGATTPSTAVFTTVHSTGVTMDSGRIVKKVAALTPGAIVTLDCSLADIFTLTPAEAESIKATNIVSGQEITLKVMTSGTTAYTLTFATGFLTTGTLSTGSSSAKTFIMKFMSASGTAQNEVSRTTAM